MIAEETLTILSQMTGRSFSPAEAETLFLHLNSENAFAPSAMISSLIEVLQLQYNPNGINAAAEPIFADILTRDRHTGYYIHAALRTLYLDFAISRAGLPHQENKNFLILGDYLNLSSVNDAIGRGATNDVMAIVCAIYLDCMTRAGVVNWLYHRSMGDEITFIVLNTPQEQVEAGLAEAEKVTDEFIQALGLERLRHKKYPNRTGTGLVTEMMTLKGNINHRTLKQEMDDAIQIRKKDKASKGWFSFSRGGGVEPDQFHNRASEQRIDRALHKFRHYKNAAQFSGEIDSKTGVRSAMNPAKSLLVGRAIAWPRDDRIEYLRQHHDNSKVMLRADIYNLGGLNSVFGHDGADHVKAHLIRILYNTICAHDFSEPKIFDCGGGIIDAVVNNMPPDQMHKMIQAIQNNIYYQVLNHTVADYAGAYNLSFAGDGLTTLANLRHPRHENEGTGLVMATHKVESARSLPEIIERLDKITHRTKMHDFVYLWTDEDDFVFGLRLNETPEPVPIGTERKDANPHYLPFTEALRQYLNQEDLPSIFERPAGQICEILFGTDMQAVLGFKKGIRMLQDAKINDDRIEEIASYADMDEMLTENNLPPLSVVSTQNRPSFVKNEREAFKTMTLAEKLEDLPRTITGLILQAQASFRTLKIVQPHGHLPPAQATQVLIDEIGQFALPDQQKDTHGAQLTESVFALSRLFDRIYAALGKDIPEEVQTALRDFSYETLKDLAVAFDNADEPLLAKKLQSYVWSQAQHPHDRLQSFEVVQKAVDPTVDKLRKKDILGPEQVAAVHGFLEGLCKIINERINTPQIAWANRD